jgi:DNA repair exonuclease SbcCD ATPase subunit
MGLFKKKSSIDAADFVALRSELASVKARLDESELARTQLEDRISALDASTTALSSMPSTPAFAPPSVNTAELAALATKVEHLEMQLGERRGAGGGDQSSIELSARVEALHNRMINLPDFSGRFVEIESQIDAVSSRLSEVSDVAQQASSTAASLPTQPAGPDPELTARIDAINARLGGLDALGQQYQLLSEQVNQHAFIADRYHQLTEQVGETHQLNERYQQLSDQLNQQAHLAEQFQQLQSQIAEAATLAYQANERANQAGAAAEHATQAAGSAAQAAQAAAEQAHAASERSAQAEQSLADVNSGAPAEVPAEVNERLGHLAERLSATDNEAKATREHLQALEQRVSGIGTELANQISELGRDIDALGARANTETPVAALDDETINALRTSQVKLANEQARYEIAFREDLATLAEQFRHPTRSAGDADADAHGQPDAAQPNPTNDAP